MGGLAASRRIWASSRTAGRCWPLENRLGGYERTKSALHFPVDEPLSRELTRLVVEMKVDRT